MFHPLVSHSFHALRSLVLHTCRAYDNIRSHERCDTYNIKASTHGSAIKIKCCGTKTKSPWRFRHRLHDHNSIGQSCSAFRTSSMQHFSAVGSAHSFTETVLFFSLTFFGLISPQHSGTPPWKSRQTEVVFVHHSHKDHRILHAKRITTLFYGVDRKYYIWKQSPLSIPFGKFDKIRKSCPLIL